MTFAHPWVLLFLIVPVLLGVWEWQRRGHPVVLPFDHSGARNKRFLGQLVKCANLIAPALLGLAIIFLAGPLRMGQPREERQLTNIHFCLDVSGSMMAPFGDGKRADKAVEAILGFINYRKGDAFGLTIFGTEVLHWVPVTKDLSALKASAPFMRPERMPTYMGGTRIANALRSIHKVMSAQKEGDRMVVLISDGESYDLRGVAEKLGEELAKDDIVVFYIHVAEGDPQQETFTLASQTGGQAFSAGDPTALQEVFKRIDAMKPAKLKPSTPEPVDFFWPFAIAGLSLLGMTTVAGFGLRHTPW